MKLWELISRLWRKHPYYLIRVVNDCPYWRTIHTIQFDSYVSEQDARAIVARWAKNTCVHNSLVGYTVEPDVELSWSNQVGNMLNVPSEYIYGRYSCRQNATPIIDWSWI